jgi:hypothetical protein
VGGEAKQGKHPMATLVRVNELLIASTEASNPLEGSDQSWEFPQLYPPIISSPHFRTVQRRSVPKLW